MKTMLDPLHPIAIEDAALNTNIEFKVRKCPLTIHDYLGKWSILNSNYALKNALARYSR